MLSTDLPRVPVSPPNHRNTQEASSNNTLSPFCFSPSTLKYADFSNSIIHRSPLPSASSTDIEVYERIIHPYNIATFARLLDKHNLTSAYPLLVDNLTSGFPLGNLPPLEMTVIIKNHPSVAENLDIVWEYIHTELEERRMSGPYTQRDVERILRGPFYCSPFIVATQDQGLGNPPKRRVCRNLSKGDPLSGLGSVNSFIDKDDFPTRFDMAANIADMVSSFLLFLIPSLYSFLSLPFMVVGFSSTTFQAYFRDDLPERRSSLFPSFFVSLGDTSTSVSYPSPNLRGDSALYLPLAVL